MPGFEPFAFLYRRDLNQVIVSAASLLFLDNVMYAFAWLNVKATTSQSVGDYLMMLRYWDPARGRPPKPLDALCIKRDPADQKVDDFAARGFNIAVVSALLHDTATHSMAMKAMLRSRRRSRAPTRRAADRFALNVIARTVRSRSASPNCLHHGLSVENRADFASDAAYQQSLGARTHPLSPQRLQAFAQHLELRVGRLCQRVQAGRQGERDAACDNDPDPVAAGCRREHAAFLGHDRPHGQPGRSRAAPEGRASRAAVPGPRGDRPVLRWISPRRRSSSAARRSRWIRVLERYGDSMSGSYSYGSGLRPAQGRGEGRYADLSLVDGPDSGNGVLTLQDGRYRGTFGSGTANSGDGTIAISKAQ